MSKKIIIVGAGVMGCACALELLTMGWQVTLLERALPGAESSAAAAGILGAQSEVSGPGVFQELCLASRQLYPEYIRSLTAMAGVTVDYCTDGVLELAMDPGEGRLLASRAQWMQKQGLKVELLDPEEVLRLEPCVHPALVGANYYPDDHHLDPVRLSMALAAAVARLGGIFKSGEQVVGIYQENGTVCGVQTPNGVQYADKVVLAGGAWSTQLAGLPVLRTSVKPMAGQIIRFESRPPRLHHVLYGMQGYIVPRPDGRVLCGSTLEERGFDKAVTADGLRRLLNMTLSMAPLLATLRFVDCWSGLRPATIDQLPLLGACSVLAGLYFATGHYRNGILLVPITARIIADLIEDKPLTLDIAAFAP